MDMNFKHYKDQLGENLICEYMNVMENHWRALDYGSLENQALGLLLTAFYKHLVTLEHINLCIEAKDDHLLIVHVGKVIEHLKMLECFKILSS
jgi:hypothetical protein